VFLREKTFVVLRERIFCYTELHEEGSKLHEERVLGRQVRLFLRLSQCGKQEYEPVKNTPGKQEHEDESFYIQDARCVMTFGLMIDE